MLRKVWIQKHTMKTDYCITKFYTDRSYDIIIVRNFSRAKVATGTFTENLEDVLNQFNLGMKNFYESSV